jgi:dihydrolipoamide dehydrogenase
MSGSAENVYDLIVIGTGPIGQTLAERARAAGLSVAAVERELVGGECSYWACIPIKAMLRPVVAVADARRVAGARQAATGPVNTPAVLARSNGYVSDWNDKGQVDWLKRIGSELLRGHGRLDGVRGVVVETPSGETVSLVDHHVVAICTGSRPALPELAGLDQVRPWTNREATDSHDVPGRLAIVGGGGVGVEMASAWSGLGATVTLLAQADGLLPRTKPFAGEMVCRTLAETGVDVRIDTTVTAVHRWGGTGPVTLTLENGDRVEAAEVRFATGRQPNTSDIGLQTAELTPGSSLDVDDTSMVRAPALTRRPLLPLHQRIMAPPPRGLPWLTRQHRPERTHHPAELQQPRIGTESLPAAIGNGCRKPVRTQRATRPSYPEVNNNGLVSPAPSAADPRIDQSGRR